MKLNINIADTEIESLTEALTNHVLKTINIEKLVEKRINEKVDQKILATLSLEKVQNFAKDRIARLLTSEELKNYTIHLESDDVLSNLEEKILLMIGNSKAFKSLVKETLKNSL